MPIDEAVLEYVQECLLDDVEAHGFSGALTRELDDTDADDYGIRGQRLQAILDVSDEMLEVLCRVDADIETKIAEQWGDPNGYNARYDSTWERLVGRDTYPDVEGDPFYGLVSCQGGDELGMVYAHPLYGVHAHMDQDEYRARSAPYVAAFRAELFPGDIRAGLVHPDVLPF